MSDELPIEDQLRIARRFLTRLDIEIGMALLEIPERKGVSFEPTTTMDCGGNLVVRMRIPHGLLTIEAKLKETIKQALVKLLPSEPIEDTVEIYIHARTK